MISYNFNLNVLRYVVPKLSIFQFHVITKYKYHIMRDLLQFSSRKCSIFASYEVFINLLIKANYFNYTKHIVNMKICMQL